MCAMRQMERTGWNSCIKPEGDCIGRIFLTWQVKEDFQQMQENAFHNTKWLATNHPLSLVKLV